MRIYKIISSTASIAPKYAGTMSVAHEIAKSVPKEDRANVRIYEADLATDKQSIIDLANGEAALATINTWSLSPRGGLVAMAG